MTHSVHDWMCQSTQMRHVRMHEPVVHSTCGWSMFWGPHIWLCMSQWIDTFISSIFIGKAVLKRPLSPTISFLPTQIEGCLFVAVDLCWGISAARPAAPARAVARLPDRCTIQTALFMRELASPLAPDLAAAISDEGGSWLTCCYHTPRIYRVAIRLLASIVLLSHVLLSHSSHLCNWKLSAMKDSISRVVIATRISRVAITLLASIMLLSHPSHLSCCYHTCCYLSCCYRTPRISATGSYQRWRSLQLSFFAITLQSKVHNAVRYFNIGPHCVPIRDMKRCL